MTKMEESEGKDTYVTQLKEVFDSCDTTGTGSLNEEELRILCEKLHLVDHTDILIHHLLKNEHEVKFEDFKECFVAVLTQTIPSGEDTSETENNEEIADREVSPKFTLGRKKYGRRSRPASIADDDSSVVSPVLSPQGSFDQVSSGETTVKMPSVENAPGKRPMSPNVSQQPPTKSGRMTEEKMVVSEDTPTSIHQASDSDADLNQSFDNNPVQYLQETWKKLNIGQSGYLNVEELALVCEHIGMDMTEEVISQLFEKLDCDQDGQISFDEFLQGLFQHGDPQSCDSPLMKSTPSKSIYNDGSRDDQISNSSISGIFSCIDPNNTGYADASSILELWESLELPCSPQLLEELGFNTNLKINLSDLTSVLEEVLCNVLKRPVLQLAFVTYQNELQYLRQSMEQMQRERNKLRVSVEEANSRAALLAQEVDDNHARLESSLHNKLLLMEKKYHEQARVLTEELQQERESMSSLTSRLKQQLQRDVDAVREEEAKLKARLHLLQQENTRLEQELHEASEKYMEAQKLNEVLQKELLIVPDLKQRLADLESHANDLQEQSHQNLLQELEKYKKSSQELQDKNDELTLEIENMQQNSASDATPSKAVNRTHSWLSDYKKTLVPGYKRRGSESSSAEENSDEENRTNGKLRKTFLSNGSQIHDIDSPTLPADGKKTIKNNQPTVVDILLKDMMHDQACLLRKLQIAEESRLKMEKAFKQSENKNKILNGLVRSMSGAVSA
ncbi:unnamed protein product [Larinioides sclopetarius]|uniref:EF-hand domain-containing protein n=1 Tax=Larinioides sclopetarius TaxID=280406 RepID=A0AAV2BLP1_9ARAC